MKQLRGFKYRIYPTLAQRLELAQTFGCTRYVYNWALALRTNSYYQDNVFLTYTDTSNALTKLKKDPEKPWLKQVSAVPLQQGLRHLNTAFINFFAGRNKYPRFKKKNNRQSAHYAPNAFKWHDRTLNAIDRWFPSSKRCNPCGHILDKLSLDVREWICPSCNNLNMRDLNAALNILAVGQTVFACGSGTLRGDRSSISSYPGMNQESPFPLGRGVSTKKI